MNKYLNIAGMIVFMFFSVGVANSQHDHKMQKTEKAADRIKIDKATGEALEKILDMNGEISMMFHKGVKEEKIKAKAAKLSNAALDLARKNRLKGEKKDKLSEILNEFVNQLTVMDVASPGSGVNVAYSRANQQLARLVRTFEVDGSYHIFYCPMEKKPWVAKGTEVNNPYVPKEMPHCGEIMF